MSSGLGSVRVHVDRPTIGRLRRRFHSQLGDAWACSRRGRVFVPEQNEPARPTAARGRPGGGGGWQTDRRDESAEFPGESAATDLPGSAQWRGPARSAWQAGHPPRRAAARQVRVSVAIPAPWHGGRSRGELASAAHSAAPAGREKKARNGLRVPDSRSLTRISPETAAHGRTASSWQLGRRGRIQLLALCPLSPDAGPTALGAVPC